MDEFDGYSERCLCCDDPIGTCPNQKLIRGEYKKKKP